MSSIVLGAKLAVATTLLIAGGAKLASIHGFAATVRLFLPRAVSPFLPRTLAGIIIAAELSFGILSLSWPSLWWTNFLIALLCAAFLSISIMGYLFYRGRGCHCFGRLARRKFDGLSIARSTLLVIIAVLALGNTPPKYIQIQMEWRILLIISSILIIASANAVAKGLDRGAKSLMNV
jgi:hypothetical protein